MIRKLISIFCIILVLSTSLVSAQFSNIDIPIYSSGEEETGESIIVNVDRIEPTVVPTNILEEQNVPVYVYLKGATLGSLALGEDSLKLSPLFGIPEIEKVSITSKKSTSNLVSNVIYVKPRDRHYVVDETGRFFDMGYLILQLRKINDERELTGFNNTVFSTDLNGVEVSAGGGLVIDAEISMDIRFDLESNFGGFGAQDLRLIENVDETMWKDSSEKDSFWARNGYVRVDRINDDSATVSVYDGRLRRLRTFTLNKGEESSPIRLQDFGPVENSFFRVRLNDVALPRNTAKIEVNGDIYELVEGQRLYPGSDWKVETIKHNEITKGKKTRYDEVVIVNGEGQRKTLRIIYYSKTQEEQKTSENEVDVDSVGYKTYQNSFGQEFVTEVEQISKDLGINPNHLMAVMAFESGFNHKAENSLGCFGLIQFCPNTGMKTVETTSAQLESMSAVQQLDLVKKYFETYKGKIRQNSLQDVYMAVLLPGRAIGREDSYVLFEKGSEGYNQNVPIKDFDNDGKKTAGEAAKSVLKVYPLTEEAATAFVSTETLLDENVCDGVQFDDNHALNQSSTRLYCKSIEEINEAINKGLIGQDLSDAHFYLGQAYEGLGENNLLYKREAISVYGLVTEGIFLGKALERKEGLEKEIGEKADVRNAKIYLEDENVNVILKSVRGINLQEQPTVTLSVNNEEKTLKAGSLVIGGKDDANRDFNWIVDSITSRRITVKQVFTSDPTVGGRTETISLDEVETLQTGKEDSAVVQILRVDSKKQAYITILPGSGRAISRSVVDVKIPIERRSIQFSTEQIDKQIENTKKVIEKLDDIINKLDKIVKTWRAICLGTFAFLTLKNWGNSDFLEAKNLVLRGVDGNSGFGQHCIQNSGAGKTYSNYDECVIANKEYIEKRAKEEVVNIKDSNDYMNSNYNTKYSEYRFSENDDILVPAEEVRELELLRLQIADSQTNLDELNADSVEYKMESDYLAKLEERYEAKKDNVDETKLNVNKAKAFSDQVAASDNTNERLKREAFEVKLNELSQNVEPVQIKVGQFNAGPITFVNGEAFDSTGNKILQVTELRGEDNKLVITEDGKTVYQSGDKYYYSNTENYYGERIRNTYARAGVAEYYDNGRPFCVPTGNGNYVRVLEYFEDGTPKTVDERNVGPNGILCDSDDVIIRSDSVVKLDPRKEQELKQAVNRAGFCRQGDYKTTNFICSHARSKALNAVNELHCTDVMGIGDCKVLFNVCDPVMCPTSRFNLGGKWYVDNVPETGIIGSLVLGMPNSNFAGGTNVIPPVCLPGLQSGLEGIRSVFQGYEECLQTSKANGENVGICDKVKSVFICENIWREAVSITGTLGVLNVVQGKLFENADGGGEYTPSQFSKKIGQVSDSAKFFLNEYSTASLSAYEARSLGQVGTEICKNIYAGKAPGIGKLIDQVITPESPPQFTAFFDEYSWASSAGDTRLNVAEGILSNVDEQSRYSVFYHIYAGRATDIRYSVYLKDTLGNVAYVTERAGGRGRGFVPAGDFVSKNIDFVGRSGYNEICVEINGKETCGFGRASTSLGIRYITDKAIESELTKNINTKEQCVPEDNSGPTIKGIASPTSFGDVTGGIVRVCSVSNPGEGGLEGRWEVVGTCGKDEEEINLGSCWIDTTTVRLNNKLLIDENVRNIVQKYDEEKGGLVTDLRNVDFAGIYNGKNNLLQGHIHDDIILSDWNYVKDYIIGYEDDGGGLRYVSVKSIDFGALAQLRIGQAYLYLANENARIEDSERRAKEVAEVMASEAENVDKFTLCGADGVYYCINQKEKCYDKGTIETSGLTQEQCRKERESKLSDTDSCSENTLNTVFTPWDRVNICHQRAKGTGSCYYDTNPLPDSCYSCSSQAVQRSQCSVYKDEDECEKWDPCVFDCTWSNNQCISATSSTEADKMNEDVNSPTVESLRETFGLGEGDKNTFSLNYQRPRLGFGDSILHIRLNGIGLSNTYYIKNDKIGSTYPIFKVNALWDAEIGYISPDGSANIKNGEAEERLLERINVQITVLDELFEKERDGIFPLSPENA